MRNPEISMDDLFWCNHLHVTREIRELKNLEIKGFNAFCSKMKKDIDDSYCYKCFLEG